MSITYKVEMIGLAICNPLALIKVVFPQHRDEVVESDGIAFCVTFDTAQTPVDLGPLLHVSVFDPAKPRLK